MAALADIKYATGFSIPMQDGSHLSVNDIGGWVVCWTAPDRSPLYLQCDHAWTMGSGWLIFEDPETALEVAIAWCPARRES